jgi:hypothetical protein
MANKAKKSNHLCKGQRWFVKINGSVSLLCAEILDITESTVMLMEPGNFDLSARYKLDDVEFVEQLVESGAEQILVPAPQHAAIEQIRKIR